MAKKGKYMDPYNKWVYTSKRYTRYSKYQYANRRPCHSLAPAGYVYRPVGYAAGRAAGKVSGGVPVLPGGERKNQPFRLRPMKVTKRPA